MVLILHACKPTPAFDVSALPNNSLPYPSPPLPFPSGTQLWKPLEAVFKFMLKKWSEVGNIHLSNIRIVFDVAQVEIGIEATRRRNANSVGDRKPPPLISSTTSLVWSAEQGSEPLTDLINSLPVSARARLCEEEVLDLTYTMLPGPIGPPPRDVSTIWDTVASATPAAASTNVSLTAEKSHVQAPTVGSADIGSSGGCSAKSGSVRNAEGSKASPAAATGGSRETDNKDPPAVVTAPANASGPHQNAQAKEGVASTGKKTSDKAFQTKGAKRKLRKPRYNRLSLPIPSIPAPTFADAAHVGIAVGGASHALATQAMGYPIPHHFLPGGIFARMHTAAMTGGIGMMGGVGGQMSVPPLFPLGSSVAPPLSTATNRVTAPGTMPPAGRTSSVSKVAVQDDSPAAENSPPSLEEVINVGRDIGDDHSQSEKCGEEIKGEGGVGDLMGEDTCMALFGGSGVDLLLDPVSQPPPEQSRNAAETKSAIENGTLLSTSQPAPTAPPNKTVAEGKNTEGGEVPRLAMQLESPSILEDAEGTSVAPLVDEAKAGGSAARSPEELIYLQQTDVVASPFEALQAKSKRKAELALPILPPDSCIPTEKTLSKGLDATAAVGMVERNLQVDAAHLITPSNAPSKPPKPDAHCEDKRNETTGEEAVSPLEQSLLAVVEDAVSKFDLINEIAPLANEGLEVSLRTITPATTRDEAKALSHQPSTESNISSSSPAPREGSEKEPAASTRAGVSPRVKQRQTALLFSSITETEMESRPTSTVNDAAALPAVSVTAKEQQVVEIDPAQAMTTPQCTTKIQSFSFSGAPNGSALPDAHKNDGKKAAVPCSKVATPRFEQPQGESSTAPFENTGAIARSSSSPSPLLLVFERGSLPSRARLGCCPSSFSRFLRPSLPPIKQQPSPLSEATSSNVRKGSSSPPSHRQAELDAERVVAAKISDQREEVEIATQTISASNIDRGAPARLGGAGVSSSPALAGKKKTSASKAVIAPEEAVAKVLFSSERDRRQISKEMSAWTDRKLGAVSGSSNTAYSRRSEHSEQVDKNERRVPPPPPVLLAPSADQQPQKAGREMSTSKLERHVARENVVGMSAGPRDDPPNSKSSQSPLPAAGTSIFPLPANGSSATCPVAPSIAADFPPSSNRRFAFAAAAEKKTSNQMSLKNPPHQKLAVVTSVHGGPVASEDSFLVPVVPVVEVAIDLPQAASPHPISGRPFAFAAATKRKKRGNVSRSSGELAMRVQAAADENAADTTPTPPQIFVRDKPPAPGVGPPTHQSLSPAKEAAEAPLSKKILVSMPAGSNNGSLSTLVGAMSPSEVQAEYLEAWSSFPSIFWEESANLGGSGVSGGKDGIKKGGQVVAEGPITHWMGFACMEPTIEGLPLPAASTPASAALGPARNGEKGRGDSQGEPCKGNPCKLSISSAPAKQEGVMTSPASSLNASSSSVSGSTPAQSLRCTAVAAEQGRSLPTLIRLGRSMTKGVALSVKENDTNLTAVAKKKRLPEPKPETSSMKGRQQHSAAVLDDRPASATPRASLKAGTPFKVFGTVPAGRNNENGGNIVTAGNSSSQRKKSFERASYRSSGCGGGSKGSSRGGSDTVGPPKKRPKKSRIVPTFVSTLPPGFSSPPAAKFALSK